MRPTTAGTKCTWGPIHGTQYKVGVGRREMFANRKPFTVFSALLIVNVSVVLMMISSKFRVFKRQFSIYC